MRRSAGAAPARLRAALCCAGLAVLGAGALEAAAPRPRLLADVRPLPRPPADGAPQALTAGRDLLFFAADNGFSGFELWASAGWPAPARMVADICPGPCPSAPHRLTPAGGLVYFLAHDPAHGGELWRSDGTAAGTFRLLDLDPGPLSGVYPERFAAAGRRLFFVAGFGEEQALWTSDGTPRGTVPLVAMPGATLLAAVGDVLLFVGIDAAHGQELWRSDGTPQGTRLLRDLAPGPESALSAGELNVQAALFGGRLLFQAYDGVRGVELWASDGTAAGTKLVRDLAPGAASSFPSRLTVAGDRLYFVAETGGEQRLWSSDGTAAGTRTVPGQPGPPLFVRPAEVFGGRLLFLAEHPAGEPELWVTDGRAGGTRRLASWGPLTSGRVLLGEFAAVAGGAVFMVHDTEQELWRTDGTPGGTRRLTRLHFAFGLVSFRGAAYFSAQVGELGTELWRSDGTAPGTRPIADLNFGDRSSSPGPFTEIGEAVVFTADDGTRGRELWRSDGTRRGTALVADLDEPRPFGFQDGLVALGRAGDGFLVATGGGAVWRSGGEPGDAVLLRDGLGFVRPARALGETLLFTSAVRDESGEEPEWVLSLWRSDGTAAGTSPVAEIHRKPAEGPFGPEAPQQVADFAVLGEALYLFFADLWRSDGTPEGTTTITALPCTESGGCPFPHHLVAAGDRLYFATFAMGDRVRETLWRSDGTPGGTVPVKTILDLSLTEFSKRQGFFAAWQLTPAESGGRVFFIGDDGRRGGQELWVSDGTAAGTRQVRDLRPGAAGSHPRWLTAYRGGVAFAADDGRVGQELWVSDGTAGGTRLVRDIAPGPASSYPQELAVQAGVLLLFAAWEPAHGLEVWQSAGSRESTALLVDVLPGPGSSAPRSFLLARDGTLFFTAGLPHRGYEPWAADLGIPPP